MSQLILATRRSALALAQSRAFARSLESVCQGVTVEELHVFTSGDRIADRPLYEVGGKGLFVKELEEALLEKRAHFAVHSYKDVPAEVAPGLAIVGVPKREDPHDVLISRDGSVLMSLPHGARVGTSSLRRSAALKSVRPDLEILPLRGNVDTRLRKLEEGAFDAIILAHAGLRRLGLAHRVTEVLSPDVMLPAIGQGALAIECRAADDETRAVMARIDHAETALAVAAERGVMRALSADCHTPIAAYAERDGDQIFLRATLAEPDGSKLVRGERRASFPSTIEEAERLGHDLGQELAQ